MFLESTADCFVLSFAAEQSVHLSRGWNFCEASAAKHGGYLPTHNGSQPFRQRSSFISGVADDMIKIM
jgi:hypothetical protein